MIVNLFYVMTLSFLVATPVNASLRVVTSTKEDPERELLDHSRELQAGAPETCGWSPLWRFENDPLYARKNPQVPCLRHSDCASFTAKAVRAPFQPCCLVNDCICGSTQSEFIPGVNRCAKFACTADADCGPGRCVSGRCNFSNVQPACTNDASCGGGDMVCFNGICHRRDPATGFLILVKNKGGKNSGAMGFQDQSSGKMGMSSSSSSTKSKMMKR